ncbi:MAG: 6-hydroxymethylpterin diphosphokinase MptE-like protein [Halanaeroarchaeum sp.]
MHYENWIPLYEQLRRDFGYDRSADERARDVLAEYARPFDTARIDVEGKTVAIAGGADSLEDEIPIAASADRVFAASTAVDVLQGADVLVDLMITDLDKNTRTAVAMTRTGRPVAVHAHGDNIDLLRRFVPEMDLANVLATTQVEPVESVSDFGGFTDGDRAAFIADHFGAGELLFPGWDFDDPTVGPQKRAKLEWAKRLLAFLERRRDERFDVLDGYRDDIDVPRQ